MYPLFWDSFLQRIFHFSIYHPTRLDSKKKIKKKLRTGVNHQQISIWSAPLTTFVYLVLSAEEWQRRKWICIFFLHFLAVDSCRQNGHHGPLCHCMFFSDQLSLTNHVAQLPQPSTTNLNMSMPKHLPSSNLLTYTSPSAWPYTNVSNENPFTDNTNQSKAIH